MTGFVIRRQQVAGQRVSDRACKICPINGFPSTVPCLQQFLVGADRLKTRVDRLSFNSVQKEASR